MGGMIMMQMSFYASPKATILFESWCTSTWQQFLPACLIVALFCVLHEYLVTLRTRYAALPANAAASPVASPDDDEAQGFIVTARKLPQSPSAKRAVITILYAINVLFSYLIMLVVMTFNAYLLLSVVLGLAVGYFLSGHMRSPSDPALADQCCVS
eukprot:jgi/Chlat1/2417/Chrsp17S02670